MEKGNETLANGKDILTDSIQRIDTVINELCRYRTVMEIMVLTYKHYPIIDDLEHERIKEVVRELYESTDNPIIKEYLQ